MPLIEAMGLCKSYHAGDILVEAIKEATFSIEPGAFVSFVGPSGSGKSTLLNMIGCLDSPTCGTLKVIDTDVSTLNHKQAAMFRGNHIGFVFQDFNLIPVLSVYENVEYPLIMVQRWTAQQRRKQVMELLEAVGMHEQAGKRPNQLSGGQKQRVAVARALVTNSKLVLADEPTANLDSATAHRVIDLMKAMREKFATTFIFSTHDPKVMAEAEVTFTLVDGRIAPPAVSA
jgi:putative ABC transport system ATP-binding protein